MFRSTDSRRRRKRRGEDADTTVVPALVKAPEFAVEVCELVHVGGGDALLRIAGNWSPDAPERVDLVAFGSGELERIEALPPGAASGADGLWHIAFSVAETATTVHLALMTPAGVPVALPAPARVLPAPIEPSPQERELASERSARSELEERLEHALEDLSDARALVDQFRRRCDLSERGLAEFRDKLVAAWGESASMRELLDEREAAHEAAKERARTADQAVAEVEARSRQAQLELATRRDELQRQCALLRDELQQSVASELSAAELLAATEELRAQSADTLARFEAARADAQSLKAELDEARALAEDAAAGTARAAREILDERVKAEDAAREADAYSERLAKAERELREAREALAAAQAGHADSAELVAALEAETARADVATERVADAERELAAAREDLAAITAHVEALEARSAAAAQGMTEELAAERSRAEAAVTRTAAAEQALDTARQELETARQQTEAESARADEAARRAGEAEWQLAQAREQLASGERAVAAEPSPAQVAVEEDLRHLLERRERELEDARAELAEQRERYTAVASTVPPSEEPAAEDPDAPWSRVDEDLLERLARARSLAGGD
jgi:hypothetical protein